MELDYIGEISYYSLPSAKNARTEGSLIGVEKTRKHNSSMYMSPMVMEIDEGRGNRRKRLEILRNRIRRQKRLV